MFEIYPGKNVTVLIFHFISLNFSGFLRTVFEKKSLDQDIVRHMGIPIKATSFWSTYMF